MRGYSIFRVGKSKIYSFWYADRLTGKRRKLTTGTPVKAEAVQFVHAFLRDGPRASSTSYTLKQFSVEYLAYSKAQHKRKTLSLCNIPSVQKRPPWIMS